MRGLVGSMENRLIYEGNGLVWNEFMDEDSGQINERKKKKEED